MIRNRVAWVLGALTVMLAQGCAGTGDKQGAKFADRPAPKEDKGVTGLGFTLPWQDKGPPAAALVAGGWKWRTAIPQGATRAEIVPAFVPEEALAFCLPKAASPELRLVSATSQKSGIEVVELDGRPIKNCQQLFAAVDGAAERPHKPNLGIRRLDGQGRSTTEAVEVDGKALAMLSREVAADQSLLSITEEGNPWVIVRSGDVRCKLMARVERQAALLHVVVAVAATRGQRRLLPVDVYAACDGTELGCLGVAETLEILYGERQRVSTRITQAPLSFAVTSEREDYLAATNYQRLQQSVDAAVGKTSMPAPLPALASLPGIAYPGPAVLGDARALSAFLLQRQMCEPGEPEHLGWVIFHGPALRKGSTVQLLVNTGEGSTPVTLSLPNQ